MKKTLTQMVTVRQMRPHSTLPLRIVSGSALLGLLCVLGLLASRPAHTARRRRSPLASLIQFSPSLTRSSARGPFQTWLDLPIVYGGVTPIPLYYLGHFTVPTGKRLVLEGISANFVDSRMKNL